MQKTLLLAAICLAFSQATAKTFLAEVPTGYKRGDKDITVKVAFDLPTGFTLEKDIFYKFKNAQGSSVNMEIKGEFPSILGLNNKRQTIANPQTAKEAVLYDRSKSINISDNFEMVRLIGKNTVLDCTGSAMNKNIELLIKLCRSGKLVGPPFVSPI